MFVCQPQNHSLLAKLQNEKPPSLSFAGGELRKRKAPISVEVSHHVAAGF